MPSSTLEYVDMVARTPLSQILIFSVTLTAVRIVSHFVSSRTPKHKQGFGVKFLSGLSDLFDSLIYAAVFIFMVIRPYFFQTFQIPTGSLNPTLKVGDFIGLNKAIYRYSEPKRGDIVVFHPPAYACSPEQLRPGTNDPKVDFVKRLIGLPGDIVEMRNGVVYINGKILWEPYWHFSEQVSQAEFRLFSQAETAEYQKQSWKLVNFKGKLIPLNYTESDANAQFPASRSNSGRQPYWVAEPFIIRDAAESESAEVRNLPAQPIPAGQFLFIGDNRNNSFDGRAWGLINRDSIIGRAEFVWLPFNRLGGIRYVDNGSPKAPDAITAEGMR
jgi:signal peptidase I